MISKFTTDGGLGGAGSNNVGFGFALAIVACFWAARHCDAEIEVNAYISNQGSNDVSVIDTGTNMVVGAPIPVGNTPRSVAVTPDGRFAYVTNAIDGTVSVIDAVTNTVVGTPIPVEFNPQGVAVTPDGKFAYVTNSNAGTVSVIATSTNSVVGSSIPVGNFPEGIAITPDGKSAYVVNQGSNSVSVIDTATNSVVPPPIPVVGGLSTGVAVTPDGKFAYVTNANADNVSVIDTTTKAVVQVVALGATDHHPEGVAVTPDGKFVYVANFGSSTVSVIDTTTNVQVHSIGLGNAGLAAGSVAITPDGKFAYVANFNTDNVSVIDTTTNLVVGSPIPVGTQPFVLSSFMGPNVIVARGMPVSVVNDAALTPLGFGAFIDFNGGTLRTLGSLITARTVSLLNAGGIIDTNGFDSIFSGDIINSGSLTKIGAGTLTLSGNNTYTGGTNIAGGVLSVSSDSNLGSAAGGLTFNGGTLQTVASFGSARSMTLNAAGGTFEPGAATTLTAGGPITGAGGLTKIGAGTVVLSGNNGYAGGTTVLAGTLQAGSAPGFVSNTAYTVNGGTLDLNNFNLIMSSFNGTGGAVNLGSAALTVDNSGTNAYSGIIQGSGSLTKVGAGTLILSGKNAYSGGTTLNAGTLSVNGAQALGFGDVVVSGGVLRADPQPINVKGSYTQTVGGTLQLTLAGTAPGQYDNLNVVGRASLDGTLQLLFLSGFQPKIGDKLTLVLAAGGVSGQFANILDRFSSLVPLELVYLPNSVLLEFASNFTAFAQTPNQIAVAAALDKVAFDPRAAQLLSFLQNEPLDNLGADFDKISPDSLSAIYEISVSAANIQMANLEHRFDELRNGSTGFTSSLNISNSLGTMVEGSNGKAVIEPDKNMLTPSPQNRWGIWISGSGQFVNVNGDGNGKGYDFTTGGVSLGLDYRLTKNFAIGVAAGYAHTWTNLTGNGNIDVNSGRGGLYATYSEGGFYLSEYMGGAYNSYDARRAALQGSANGSTNSGEFDGYAGGGYEFHCGGFTFGPTASLEYSDVEVRGYTESGSLAPLRIVSQSQDSLRTNVGLRASYTWSAGKVQLRPSLRASWQHEYFYSALPIDAQFASGAGGIFTVTGPDEGHDSALIDAGVDIQWTPTIGTYFGYNGDVARSNYNSHSVICSVNWIF